MLEQRMIGQPGIGGARTNNVDAIVDLLGTDASAFDAAVAYVTNSGVDTLLASITAHGVDAQWKGLTKRFLVGIDWYRSDPTALQRLADLPAEVRVHDGIRVVDRRGCVPFVPWHPKWFAVRGPTVKGQLVGSGNLSRNGLRSGHEAGMLQIVREPSDDGAEKVAEAAIRGGEVWFEDAWTSASPLSSIISKYHQGFATIAKAEIARNDDVADASGRVGKRYGLRAEQLAALTGANNFWIEAGSLSRNRGPSRPGNQLMMSALMRVYFGLPANEVPKNTTVGSAVIEHPLDRSMTVSAPIRFSDNSMDVVSLPVPESPWPTYDSNVLLFTKVARGEALHFILTVRSVGSAREWQSTSKAQGTSFAMRSGRRWGVFG